MRLRATPDVTLSDCRTAASDHLCVPECFALLHGALAERARDL